MIITDENFKGYYDAKNVKKERIKEELLEFQKLKSNFNGKNSYVLNLNFQSYLDLYSSNVEAFILIKKEDNTYIEVPKFKIRHLFPNKNYYTITQKIGRSFYNNGIALFFDNFEELNKIKEITIVWKLTDNDTSIFVHTKLFLNFIKENDKYIYSIQLLDMLSDSYFNKTMDFLTGKNIKHSTFYTHFYKNAYVYLKDGLKESMLSICRNCIDGVPTLKNITLDTKREFDLLKNEGLYKKNEDVIMYIEYNKDTDLEYDKYLLELENKKQETFKDIIFLDKNFKKEECLSVGMYEEYATLYPRDVINIWNNH